MTRAGRAARLATALAAMGLVFMGAIVEPVYLVPALTVVLALGLRAEIRPGLLPGAPRRLRYGRPAPELSPSYPQPAAAIARQDPAAG